MPTKFDAFHASKVVSDLSDQPEKLVLRCESFFSDVKQVNSEAPKFVSFF